MWTVSGGSVNLDTVQHIMNEWVVNGCIQSQFGVVYLIKVFNKSRKLPLLVSSKFDIIIISDIISAGSMGSQTPWYQQEGVDILPSSLLSVRILDYHRRIHRLRWGDCSARPYHLTKRLADFLISICCLCYFSVNVIPYVSSQWFIPLAEESSAKN